MDSQSGSADFGYLLVGIPDDVQYYVESGGIRSDTFKLHTIDLPAVKNISVTYNYPSWTGLAPTTEDPGGDLRAVEGTVAKLGIQTDKPLANARIVLENGKPIELDATKDNRTTASIPVEKDGSYHIAVMDHGELVRLTDDYFIEARKVDAPTVHITKPGNDAKVSPIEEVQVAVTGEDEYPLQELDLHYSVNGAGEKVISLLKEKGAKKVDGTTMLSMEDYKLVPGDIVSLYATARDGKNSARTDMFFIQAVPFEFEYSQSQQAGGGGGGRGRPGAADFGSREGNHRRNVQSVERRCEGKSRRGGERQVSLRSAGEAARTGAVAGQSRQSPAAGRQRRGVPAVRERDGRCGRGDDAGLR